MKPVLTPCEVEAARWMALLGPVIFTDTELDAAARELCRQGLARPVFIDGVFYFEAKTSC